MLLGLNILIDIRRRAEARDSIGGAVYTEAAVNGMTGLHARLGNASRSAQMMLHEQGYDSLRANEIVIQPASLDVRENDLVLVHGGQWDGVKFVVRSVRRDNLLPSDPRSHAELLCERSVEARSTP